MLSSIFSEEWHTFISHDILECTPLISSHEQYRACYSLAQQYANSIFVLKGKTVLKFFLSSILIYIMWKLFF